VKLVRPAVVALAAVLGFGACTSQPSPKAVAQDYIESIDGLTPEQRQCMLDKLDEYDSDTLTSIGDANLNVDFDQPDAVESGTPAFQDFVANLNSCMSGSG
jgi:hypothetical protein